MQKERNTRIHLPAGPFASARHPINFCENMDSPSFKPDATRLVTFKPSSIHGIGGFAKVRIAAGTHILQYKGKLITKAESINQCEQNNPFIFSLDENRDLDGNVPENLARFINHSCRPNCEMLLDNEEIWLVSLRFIEAGEELTFNYGFDLEDYRDHPCNCGAPECVGFIVGEQFFEHVRIAKQHQ